jgi:hypothetical protein
MARRHDSGWRDGRLTTTHAGYGFDLPLAGMTLPMVEYDRGEALAVINYVRRDTTLPKGPAVGRAYYALAALHGPLGTQLPFLTVRYDPRNWAFQIFGHNGPAVELIGCTGWLSCTEEHFARLLYRLRGRQLPDLTSYGVAFATAPWLGDDVRRPQAVTGWEGQDISVRRRAYEPEPQQDGQRVSFNMRLPCSDIDLAVVGQQSHAVELLVDYKLDGAYVNPAHKTHQAMSGIIGSRGDRVPSMIVRYDVSGEHWRFHALALNDEAKTLLRDVLVRTNAVAANWPAEGWVYLDERRWLALLEDVRSK